MDNKYIYKNELIKKIYTIIYEHDDYKYMFLSELFENQKIEVDIYAENVFISLFKRKSSIIPRRSINSNLWSTIHPCTLWRFLELEVDVLILEQLLFKCI